MYLRELREVSITNPDMAVLVCTMFTVTITGGISAQEVYYVNGDNCVNVTDATPILFRTLEAQVVSFRSVDLTIPVADDTRSDWLGIFNLDPTDDTADR